MSSFPELGAGLGVYTESGKEKKRKEHIRGNGGKRTHRNNSSAHSNRSIQSQNTQNGSIVSACYRITRTWEGIQKGARLFMLLKDLSVLLQQHSLSLCPSLSASSFPAPPSTSQLPSPSLPSHMPAHAAMHAAGSTQPEQTPSLRVILAQIRAQVPLGAVKECLQRISRVTDIRSYFQYMGACDSSLSVSDLNARLQASVVTGLTRPHLNKTRKLRAINKAIGAREWDMEKRAIARTQHRQQQRWVGVSTSQRRRSQKGITYRFEYQQCLCSRGADGGDTADANTRSPSAPMPSSSVTPGSNARCKYALQ